LQEPARRRLALTICALLLLALLALIFTYRLQPATLNHILRARFDQSLAASNDGSQGAIGGSGSIEVKRGSVKKTLLLDGELRAVQSRTIYGSSSDEAKIVFMPPEGSVVKAGDVVVDLDNASILTKIKDIEERIVAAENEVVRTKSQHESTLRDLEIELSKLWLTYEQAKLKAKVPNEVVSRREFQEAQLALEKAKTEYEIHLNKIEQKKKEQTAELQVKTIEKSKLSVQLERAKGDLESMRIKAPTDGMVLYNDHWNERRKIQVGDVVWGGFPIVRLPDLTAMETLAQVNEVDGPKLSVGARAEIKLDSYPDQVIAGEIKDISQTAIKASWMAKAKIFRVTVSLDRTVMEIMKPGMSAQVSVVVDETPSNLLIPRASVKTDGESAKVVRVEKEGARREIAVTILAADGLNYLVADNGALKEGDRILPRAE
jgi:HlyD family secretion protein